VEVAGVEAAPGVEVEAGSAGVDGFGSAFGGFRQATGARAMARRRA
jgi:hypothetical protein